MKTLIFCTSLLTEDRIPIYAEWWNYYRKKFPDAKLMIINDGKIEDEVFQQLQILTNNQIKKRNVKEFDTKLGKDWHYHWGWWRSFIYALRYGKKRFDKIIHIECDAIILSDRLFEYLKNQNTGWKCMFSPSYGFPESAIQILNKDKYYLIDQLPESYDFFKIVELFLPFRSNKDFIGDRYGEAGKLPEHKIDFVCQWDWNWHIDKDWIEN